MFALDVLLLLLSIPALLGAGYLCVLAILARHPKVPAAPATLPKFTILVPSHNEELGITATVQSLLAIDYPRERFDVLVIADNCSDRTAELARAAGGLVLERNDTSRRGKGFALEYAFEHVAREGTSDAVAVVDADTSVSPNLLRAFAARIQAGAHAAQAHYSVRNPGASWRTRLMTLALTLFHGVRSLARERLELSAGLRGNGMCFSKDILVKVPHDAYSIVEDLEYGIKLGLQGIRVHYAGEAVVYGDMVANERESRSQRQRWEAGRRQITKQYGWPLVKTAFARKDLMLFDLAMDVLVPPLASIVAFTAFGLMASVLWVWFGGRSVSLIAPWAVASLMLTIYVLRGVALSGLGPRALLDLMWAPVYVVWKIFIRVRRLGAPKDQWVRTARNGNT
jgi:cellulose synthase/poly-beta-1,6-N-acetylglucosamine synthase-like glycosyltransferase